MDKSNQYQQALKTIIERYTSYGSGNDEVRHESVIDPNGDHYEVVVLGWQNGRRVYHIMMHFDIINDKVWIQANNTDRELADELIELGIPKEDIVLGFHPEYLRKHTGFAVS